MTGGRYLSAAEAEEYQKMRDTLRSIGDQFPASWIELAKEWAVLDTQEYPVYLTLAQVRELKELVR